MYGSPIYVYISCNDVKEARKIAGHCVQERIAASANVLPAIESVYWWDGQINNEPESVLILKTMDNHFDVIE